MRNVKKRITLFVVGITGVVLLAAVLLQLLNAFRTNGASTPGPRWSASTARAVRPHSAEVSTTTKQQIVANYGRLPLSFEANRGQTDPRVKFISRGSGYSLFLTGTETVLTLNQANPAAARSRAKLRSPSVHEEQEGSRAPQAHATVSAVLRMKLVGVNPAAKVEGVDELPGKSNYFIGNDPAEWRTNLPNYAKVKYQRVYPGIDLVHYGNQRQLEYDFLVAPGSDPRAIRLSFQGADALEIDAQGDLVLHTAAGEVREHKPVVYQEVAGVRQAIVGSYVLRSNDEVGFAVAP